MDSLKITIGADPEFFITSKSGNVVSAENIIGGTKKHPRKLERDSFFVQEDNVAVEFNIPPANNVESFVESINWSIQTIKNELSYRSLRPLITASAIFPPYALNTAQAQEFGCEPDFNAWESGRMNCPPRKVNPLLRSCGGHIHIGLHKKPRNEEQGTEYILDMVKAMDLFLGVPAVLMDDDTRRRSLYGQAGAYRYAPHAPLSWEYRVLSNFWIKTPEYSCWAYEQTIRAIMFVLHKGHKQFNKFLENNSLGAKIQGCINGSNVILSQRLVIDHDLVLV